MRSQRVVWIASVALLLAPVAMLAHHGLEAQFDTNQPVTLTGTVTKVEWINPHARLYLEVKDDHNAVSTWELDMSSGNQLMLNGWKLNTVRRGDRVTVEAYRARNGSNLGYAKSVKASH